MSGMGWNLDVACIAARPGTELDDSVPDVFGVTERRLGFEDATSSARFPELCAARIKDWYVVLDPGCRLCESADYPIEASAHGDAFLIHVGDAPHEKHYRNGKPQKLHAIEGDETAAWAAMTKHTGLTYDDLFAATYTVFEVD